MSSGDVTVLSTKLDILIDDFKDFKNYAIGFIMAIVIPIAVYILIQLTQAQMDIAILQSAKGAK